MTQRTRMTIFLAFLVSAMLTNNTLYSQTATGENSPTEQSNSNKMIVDIEFKGGTVSTYLAHIREVAPDARILCSSAASSIPLPSIMMKKVPVLIGLESLETVTQSQSTPLSVSVNYFELSENDVEQSMIFQIDVLNPPQIDSTVVNASHALELFARNEAADPAEQLKETIQTGLETIFNEGGEQTVIVKLHEATGLLFIKGENERVEFVMDIIDQLSRK